MERNLMEVSVEWLDTVLDIQEYSFVRSGNHTVLFTAKLLHCQRHTRKCFQVK